MRLRILKVVAIVAAVAPACGKTEAPPPPPAPEVYVTPVVQQDVAAYLDLVGQTVGSQEVEIRARVEGFLDAMTFEEGSFVRKGSALYQIDRKPFEAAVAGAQADLATARARLDKARNDVTRYTPLVAKQAVSQQELDDARSAQQAAQSQVEAALAAVEQARLNLGYTTIVAPISGLVGKTLVKPGNLVGRGEPTLLTTISQIDPMLLDVGVTEQDYLRIIKRNPGRTRAEARDGIELTLADGTVYPYKGRVRNVDRAVNPMTGTLAAQLEFPNPEFLVRPGAYGRVRVLIDSQRGALLVPQRAVQEQQGLYRVAVVGANDTVEVRTVKVGLRLNDMWVIEEGLAAGERVVAEGVQAIRDGTVVRATAMSDQPVATGGTQPPSERK